MVLLNNVRRRAEQAANDARRNRRYLPSFCTEEELARLDAAARAAQDAVTAHQLVKAVG